MRIVCKSKKAFIKEKGNKFHKTDFVDSYMCSLVSLYLATRKPIYVSEAWRIPSISNVFVNAWDTALKRIQIRESKLPV